LWRARHQLILVATVDVVLNVSESRSVVPGHTDL
jgi:hypothetical protein